ncbi:MAG: hypothetical protein OER85_17455, partial [Gammaproteobacteria bacterium]|nr:hypothetical protein [Gammaproteobacteria bacterium]
MAKKTFVSLITAVLVTGPVPAIGQANDAAEWDHYGGGQHGMQYSSLSQISRDNVGSLEEI